MEPQNIAIITPQGINIDALFRALMQIVFGSSISYDTITGYLWAGWVAYSIFAFALSAFFLYGIIYAIMRTAELSAIRNHALHELEHQVAEHHHTSKNKRWEDAMAHIASDNPNDWRQAIIEADIMLEDVLESLGYGGITIGDKLKQASPQFFKTLDDAWKAHRVRNEIAHKGSDFVLTKRLATETIERYRRVFEEFSII